MQNILKNVPLALLNVNVTMNKTKFEQKEEKRV
jgi:hypothetical protein